MLDSGVFKVWDVGLGFRLVSLESRLRELIEGFDHQSCRLER